MYDVAIEILNIINENGFEAYIIGGYVRDKLLGINSEDIDITTNAKTNDLEKIFDNIEINEKYGSSIVTYKGFKYEITTYRKDISYEDNRWPKIEYVSSLNEDILRRDFTINAIAIDKNGNYIDLVSGIEDINNKIIRCIGSSDNKIKEDCLRILRAIRFMIVLDFNLDKELLNSIERNIDLLDNLSFDRKKEELNYIFKSNNLNKYIKQLNDLKILEKLKISLKNSLIWCDNILGIWAQLDFSNDYNFTKEERTIIEEVKTILQENNIDSYTVYKCNLKSINIASQILNIDVKNIIDNMPIKSRNDINIDYETISNILNTNQINNIYIDLEKEILYNNLKNEREDIINYISNNYERN